MKLSGLSDAALREHFASVAREVAEAVLSEDSGRFTSAFADLMRAYHERNRRQDANRRRSEAP